LVVEDWAVVAEAMVVGLVGD
jgi:hypothetical protein